MTPEESQAFWGFLLVLAFPVSFLFGLYVYRWMGGGKK